MAAVIIANFILVIIVIISVSRFGQSEFHAQQQLKTHSIDPSTKRKHARVASSVANRPTVVSGLLNGQRFNIDIDLHDEGVQCSSFDVTVFVRLRDLFIFQFEC